MTPEELEAIRFKIEANEARRKEKIAENIMAKELIDIGYNALRSRLRPKLPIDQKHLKLLKIAKARLMKFVEQG
jgi:hypothetical protein